MVGKGSQVAGIFEGITFLQGFCDGHVWSASMSAMHICVQNGLIISSYFR